MTHNGWYEALQNALKQHEDKAPGPVMQFATVEPSDGPRVRTIGHYDFVVARSIPALPLVLSVTDVRARKVAQLTANNTAEVAYWMPNTEEQFRILGRASIVPRKEGFDWEAKRREVFDGMSGRVRASWCRPVAGTPLKGGEEEMKKWPRTLPRLGEATNEEERKNLDTAIGNFALLLIEPFEVDHLELGNELKGDRRTIYQRDWKDEHNVEFKDTMVVP